MEPTEPKAGVQRPVGSGRAPILIGMSVIFVAGCDENGHAISVKDMYLYKDSAACHRTRIPGPSYPYTPKDPSPPPENIVPVGSAMIITTTQSTKGLILCMKIRTPSQEGWVMYHRRYFHPSIQLPRPALSCQSVT